MKNLLLKSSNIYNIKLNYNLKNSLYHINNECFTVNYLRKLKNPERIYKYRRFNNEQMKEQEEFKQKYNQRVKEIREEYWKEQTKVENDYIEFFNKKEQIKNNHKNIKDKTWIIKESMNCYNNMKKMMINQQKFIAKQKLWRLEDEQKYNEKQALLTLLSQEAEKHWLTPQNFNQKISNVLDSILPPSIVSHKDYYNKLNKYSILLEQGRLEEAEVVKREDLNQTYKNKLLEPIYNNLKAMIRNISYTFEHNYYDMYLTLKQRIENNYDVTQGIGFEITNTLKNKFKELILKQRSINEAPNNKLELIEKQITNIMSLMITWNRYCEVLYMSNEELHEFSLRMSNKYNPMNPDKVYEDQLNIIQMEEILEESLGLIDNSTKDQKSIFLSNISDTEKKLSFIKQIEKNPSAMKEENRDNVNDSEKTKTSTDTKSKNVKSLQEKKYELLESEAAFEDLDLEDTKLDDASLLMDEILNSIEDINTQNKNDYEAKQLLKEDFFNIVKGKDNNDFNKFKTTNQAQINVVKHEKEKYENSPFYKSNSINDSKLEDLSYLDTINTKDDEEKKAFKRNLDEFDAEAILKSDYFERILNNNKNIYSFKDTHSEIDIYSESLISYLEYAIIEAAELHDNFNTSLVIKYLKTELENINEEALSPEERYKKKYLIKLANYIAHLPIKDAQNLKKIYDLYSNEPVKFD